MQFLVVEDEEYLADMIGAALEQLGNRCTIARSAEEADRVLASRPIEAVTLDLGMPGRNGLTWLEAMAARQPELARRTLVITGMELDPRSAERLAHCGAGMLAKPFRLDHLREALRVQVQRAAAARNGEN